MFGEFNRKEIGNNAPNDGFGRFEVHGWAFGSTDLVGTFYHGFNLDGDQLVPDEIQR